MKNWNTFLSLEVITGRIIMKYVIKTSVQNKTEFLSTYSMSVPFIMIIVDNLISLTD
jgi:hypothetical protein